MKPARKVTARSNEHSTGLPIGRATVKRGTRVTLRNVKVPGGPAITVAGYIERVPGDGSVIVNTWGLTNAVRVPVSMLGNGSVL